MKVPAYSVKFVNHSEANFGYILYSSETDKEWARLSTTDLPPETTKDVSMQSVFNQIIEYHQKDPEWKGEKVNVSGHHREMICPTIRLTASNDKTLDKETTFHIRKNEGERPICTL